MTTKGGTVKHALILVAAACISIPAAGGGLLEPKAGFWLRVSSDIAVSLDQQYQP